LKFVDRFLEKYSNIIKIREFGAELKHADVKTDRKIDGGRDKMKLIVAYFVQWPTNAHNYFTNYHTATCFDTILSSSYSL